MKYKNRYGDIIECVKLDDNHYELKSMLKLGTWKMIEEELCYSQGGPNISIGTDLGLLYPELKGKIVKKISTTEGVVLEV